MIFIIVAAVALLLFFLVGMVYDRLWNHKLSADLNFEEDCAFEGEKTALSETIVNDKILPLPILEIDFHLGNGLRFTDAQNSTVSDKLYRRDVFSLGLKQKITRRLELQCAKRGYYTLTALGLMAKDLFLFKKYIAKIVLFREFFVYPRRLNTQQIAIPYNRIMGEVLSRERLFADPFEFGGIRNYMISDPMKYINWKASAKSGNLVVNLHDSSLSQTVVMVLDTYDSAAPLEDELNEECIRLAAALSERIMAAGISLALYGNGFDLISGDRLSLMNLAGLGTNQLRRTLARLTWDDSMEIGEILKHTEYSKNSLTILISKNRDSSAGAMAGFPGDAIWLCPYRGEEPPAPAGKYQFIPWLDESPMY